MSVGAWLAPGRSGFFSSQHSRRFYSSFSRAHNVVRFQAVIASASEAIHAATERKNGLLRRQCSSQRRGDTASRSRGAARPSYSLELPALDQEGAGNAGRPMRPIAARAMVAIERTRVSQVTPEIARHSPRNGFTAYNALSPVTGFLATVAPGKPASQELDASIGASGPHDFAVRLTHHSSKAHSASTASCPASVTISSRPSVGQDGASL